MSSITIGDLDPSVKERLRVRAARHGRSMEAEALQILKNALDTSEASRVTAIARVHRATAVTLNVLDFERFGRPDRRSLGLIAHLAVVISLSAAVCP